MRPIIKCNVLSLILLTFTMVSLAAEPCFAGMFIPPTNDGKDNNQPAKKPQPQPDPKKLLEAAPTIFAVKHCIVLSNIITKQAELVDAFNYQPDLDNLPPNADYVEKQKAMLYMMGRPDLPDFGFLIPQIWTVTNRNLRQKFNSVATLKIAEAINVKPDGYAFQGNCKATMQGGITKDKNNYEFAQISMPLAFDTKEVRITYILKRQPNYNWQIDDLLVDNAGITNFIKKDLIKSATQNGLPETTKLICQSAKLPTLKCE